MIPGLDSERERERERKKKKKRKKEEEGGKEWMIEPLSH